MGFQECLILHADVHPQRVPPAYSLEALLGCRFGSRLEGGLRCPSEVLSLRWQDVDWERSRIEVRSPKTEHHPGMESRTIPIFAESRPYLEEAFELAA